MKKLFFVLFIFIFITCENNSDNKKIVKQEISTDMITGDMKCENCGMNIKKYISTSHAIKLNNNEAHFYCSINCSSIALEKFGKQIKNIYGIDYGLTKYYNVEKLHYVIGANLRGTMTKVSKFAFFDTDKAKSFKETFGGKQICSYQDAYKMSIEEIKSRRKN